MSPVPSIPLAHRFAFPARARFTGKVAATVALAMLLAACASGAKCPEARETGWNDDSVQESKRQRELMLQSNWRGKTYKDLLETFGEPVSELNIPGDRSPETFAVVYVAGEKASNCIDTFTVVKVEDSREWVVNDYFCR